MYSEDQVPQQLKSTTNPMPDRSKLYRAAPLTHYYKTRVTLALAGRCQRVQRYASISGIVQLMLLGGHLFQHINSAGTR